MELRHRNVQTDPAPNRNACRFPALRGTYQLSTYARWPWWNGERQIAWTSASNADCLVENPSRFKSPYGRPLTVLECRTQSTRRACLAAWCWLQKRTAVFSMLSDRTDGVFKSLKTSLMERWCHTVGCTRHDARACKTNCTNTASKTDIRRRPQKHTGQQDAKAGENDRIVVFYLFHTVADVMSILCAKLASENKQNEVLSGYEQPKRRNRRRLGNGKLPGCFPDRW